MENLKLINIGSLFGHLIQQALVPPQRNYKNHLSNQKPYFLVHFTEHEINCKMFVLSPIAQNGRWVEIRNGGGFLHGDKICNSEKLIKITIL
jgi:hypothetical protein